MLRLPSRDLAIAAIVGRNQRSAVPAGIRRLCRNSAALVPAYGLTVLFVCLATTGRLSADEVKVARGFDNAPFSYHIELESEHESFRVYRVSYPSPVASSLPQNNTVPAELYLPKDCKPDAARRPAVICMHILGGGFELIRLQCTALASRGIPAFWFKLPYYGERGLPDGVRAVAADPQLFVKALDQGQLDVRRAVDLLASRPEIDRQQIGITGISLGGIVAATAAEREPRLSRAALILAGGDLLTIIHHARETRLLSDTLHRLPPVDRATMEQAIRRADPLEHADALRERAVRGRVLMINAAEDEVIPRACTVKLADALGLGDRVVWLDGLGHYTAIAALPRILKTTDAFFAQDLPPDARRPETVAVRTPRQKVVQWLQQSWALVGGEPRAGHCHLAEMELHATAPNGRKINGRVRVVRGPRPEFCVRVQLPGIADAALGQGDGPWMASDKTLFHGVLPPGTQATDPIALANPGYVKRFRLVEGILAALAMSPEIIDQWVAVEEGAAEGDLQVINITRRGTNDRLRLLLHADDVPARLEFDVRGARGQIVFHAWQIDAISQPELYNEPQDLPVKEVAAGDLMRMWAAGFDFAAEMLRPPPAPLEQHALRIVGRDAAGHGLLCEAQGKRILFVGGTPEQMGSAQGRLVPDQIQRLAERVVYGVGAVDSMRSGVWWFDRTAEIERRAGPHVPPRFLAECDAMARAARVSPRDARVANFFPERFHCSGVALRGPATADGRVLQARVLDYMRDIGLQSFACVAVYMPQGQNAWVSAGYTGFLGTVTAMNERGLAVGEIGGRGDGQWDGVPMSFLLRDIMERAGTVEEALKIVRESPRTCEYYYIFSDRTRTMVALHCDPRQVEVLKPGEQDPRLPHVPADTVLVSGGERASALSDRIAKDYGRIDAQRLMEIVKRPVASNSNLHDAIFSPETLDFWIADAGRTTPACDEPYARFNLGELLRFYREHARP